MNFWRSPLRHLLGIIIKQQEKIMAALDDLNAAVSALKDEVTVIAADLDSLAQQLAAAVAANNAPAISQAAADIQASVDALKAAAAKDMPPATT